eukprot:gene4385-7612_t
MVGAGKGRYVNHDDDDDDDSRDDGTVTTGLRPVRGRAYRRQRWLADLDRGVTEEIPHEECAEFKINAQFYRRFFSILRCGWVKPAAPGGESGA